MSHAVRDHWRRVAKSQRLFSDGQIREIRKLRDQGHTLRKLAEWYNTSNGTIRKICLRETYTDVE